MSGTQNLKKFVRQYQAQHLNNSPRKFAISKPYDLIADWEKGTSYPFCADQGVYAIFDKNWRLLYLGKASNKNTIGGRLGSYFKYGPHRKCVLKHSVENWGKRPRYIVATKVNRSFEAPSLEEFLIEKLIPLTNKVGRT